MAGACGSAATQLTYPDSWRSPQKDELHGHIIADPYRWLESPKDSRTKAWVEAQNKVTFGYLETLPYRERIRKRFEKLWNYTKYGVPTRRGDNFFYSRKDGLQNQPVLYVSKGPSGEPRALLDPNTFSKEGTTALQKYAPSRDGKWLAYQLSKGGSDWVEIRVRNVETGEDTEDHLQWVKFSPLAWVSEDSPLGLGFFYTRYDAPVEGAKHEAVNRFHKLYFHRLGTEQSADKLFYHRPDKEDWGFGARVTDDGDYVIIGAWSGTSSKNAVFYADLRKGGSVKPLFTAFNAGYRFIHNEGRRFVFWTDLDAPKGRLVRVDIRKPRRLKELVAEQKDALDSVNWIGGKFVAHYLQDAHSLVRLYDGAGKVTGTIPLPTLGTVREIKGRAEDKDAYFSFHSYTFPTTIYRFSFDDGQNSVYRKAGLDVQSEQYETKQVFYTSKDGTKVPMFVTSKKGITLDGSNPVYLYGYGGFNIPITPYFSVANMVWLEMGGILAYPSLRGGSEYGEAWHEAGMKERKQNVFDDFIAAAEYLVAEGYTRSERLSIAGYSNGGLLTAACMAQRPDLYGAVISGVGVLDMLRFHKFTIGWAWTSEYGSPDKKEDFEVILKYSPLHNLKVGTSYPATLITTADHDDRVVPAHSFKFISELQHSHRGENPVLIRIDTKAGHGRGKSTAKRIAEYTDVLTFLVNTLGYEVPNSFGRNP